MEIDENFGNAMPRRLAMSLSPPPSSNKKEGKLIKEEPYQDPLRYCKTCKTNDDPEKFLLCDECDGDYHMTCLTKPLDRIPESDWYCDHCLYGSGEYGFDEGEDHCLSSFHARDEEFRRYWFEKHPPNIKNNSKGKPNGVEQLIGTNIISEDDVEREFWRLVESQDETVETEYGADIHTTETGSAFPSPKRDPYNKYAQSGWNLENMPSYDGSILSYIKSDVSGMTVPWIYVGMMFSTFCWHNEDHYTYSVNYMHWGETKTWYGVPGKDHETFENAMRNSAPDLFDQQPDLLLQLVTLGNPGFLSQNGVPIYACDQRPNEFVITFPKAFHCGFNHGLNFNEAVNFACPDWIPDGKDCIDNYRKLKRNPVFSHDELLITILKQGFSDSIWLYLKHQVIDLIDQEKNHRKKFLMLGGGSNVEKIGYYTTEDDYQCSFCRAYTYLSQFYNSDTRKVYCHKHCKQFYDQSLPHNRVLKIKYTDKELDEFKKLVTDHKLKNSEWVDEVKNLLNDSSNLLQLDHMKKLIATSNNVPGRTPEFMQLKGIVKDSEIWITKVNRFTNDRVNDPISLEIGSKLNYNKSNSYENLCLLLNDPIRYRVNLKDFNSTFSELESIKNDLDWAINESYKFIDKDYDAKWSQLTEFKKVLNIFLISNVRNIKEADVIFKIERKNNWLFKVSDDEIDKLKYINQVDKLLTEAEFLGFADHSKLTTLREKKQSGERWKYHAIRIGSFPQCNTSHISFLLDMKEIHDQRIEDDCYKLLKTDEEITRLLNGETDNFECGGNFLENAKKYLKFVKTKKFKLTTENLFENQINLYGIFINRIISALRLDLSGFNESKLELQCNFDLERIKKLLIERFDVNEHHRNCFCGSLQIDNILTCQSCTTVYHKLCLSEYYGNLEVVSLKNFQKYIFN